MFPYRLTEKQVTSPSKSDNVRSHVWTCQHSLPRGGLGETAMQAPMWRWPEAGTLLPQGAAALLSACPEGSRSPARFLFSRWRGS